MLTDRRIPYRYIDSALRTIWVAPIMRYASQLLILTLTLNKAAALRHQLLEYHDFYVLRFSRMLELELSKEMTRRHSVDCVSPPRHIEIDTSLPA